MRIKAIAIAALVTTSQAQLIQIPLVTQLLDALGAVGDAIETATGLTSGAGNNPLGLAGSLPGILGSLTTVTGLLSGLNNILPLFGNGGIPPEDEGDLCDALDHITAQQANLTAAVKQLKARSPIIGGLVGGLLKTVVDLVVGLVLGLLHLTPDCDVDVDPALGVGVGVGTP
ncbi:uncharacterized protein B0I36DRAFT_366183 [Microdochium trichocladiopsis]|uniref:Hydrophobic surface binding protein A-domain-containing protein n=1 Tax=Microdochium trichocladiopsis TaxID=1682393 RepID=A0A9P8Y0P6_9PEZI|nr:uncharacterized protein B0I36DRAFT_366183 [Microdochium trichocladiopsis]KAH7026644.1 hypothetical protein B0I36DRAFT_366183 [Microdochium trichocladiopsis]